MLRFHGKDLKAVLTETISRNRPVVLTCNATVSLSVQDGERFHPAPGHEGQLRHQAFADGCHPDRDSGWTTFARMLTGNTVFTKPLDLTEGRVWDILNKNHQLTLMLSANNIDIYNGERHYVPVACYRDLTDRMHVAAVWHFNACNALSELKFWRMTVIRLLQDMRPIACRHARPVDHHNFLLAAHNLQRRTECVSPSGALLLSV
ncbi:hypothetical protein ACFSFZ_15640 [Mixta tenebrionis]|uniref:Uncharacterized protein n=2 Tax=Mixta TaxID=2100764 RepID=A0A6P1Q3I8_9GAMM|nr:MULTISPECIES: hypothetical protein [Mixta]QHM72617.1 hypothetical protein C7M51_02935 [Mixta intestinalis]TPW38359.1 hypothetical protein FKM52_20455 [Mixta tenebrionis]